jgi:hypothetical protein
VHFKVDLYLFHITQVLKHISSEKWCFKFYFNYYYYLAQMSKRVAYYFPCLKLLLSSRIFTPNFQWHDGCYRADACRIPCSSKVMAHRCRGSSPSTRLQLTVITGVLKKCYLICLSVHIKKILTRKSKAAEPYSPLSIIESRGMVLLSRHIKLTPKFIFSHNHFVSWLN